MVLELRKQLGQFVQRADAVLNRQTLGERLAFRVIPTAVDADAPCRAPSISEERESPIINACSGTKSGIRAKT